MIGFLTLAAVITVLSLRAAFRDMCEEGLSDRAGLRENGAPPVIHWECDRGRCRAANPPYAKFCRMCGRPRGR
ncbi:MAG: hypothetical protein HRU71_07645 [Planctomycetia bacterium]|nr:MAG: hypothetical protein HRU71_07645 [Planctomycetia bacterium]